MAKKNAILESQARTPPTSHVVPKNEPTTDKVYELWWKELHHYRMYERNTVTYASSVLLGFMAGATALFARENSLLIEPVQRTLLLIGIIVFAVTAEFITFYVGRRYRQLRKMTNSIEPEWKLKLNAEFLTPLPKVFNPLVGNAFLLAILAILACLTVASLPTFSDKQPASVQAIVGRSNAPTASIGRKDTTNLRAAVSGKDSVSH